MIANIVIRLFFPFSNAWSFSPIFQLLQIRQSTCISKNFILLSRFFICSSGLASSEFLIFSNCSSASAFFVFFFGSFFMFFHFCGFIVFGIKKYKNYNPFSVLRSFTNILYLSIISCISHVVIFIICLSLIMASTTTSPNFLCIRRVYTM